jgi:hypothetical protein
MRIDDEMNAMWNRIAQEPRVEKTETLGASRKVAVKHINHQARYRKLRAKKVGR